MLNRRAGKTWVNEYSTQQILIYNGRPNVIIFRKVSFYGFTLITSSLVALLNAGMNLSWDFL